MKKDFLILLLFIIPSILIGQNLPILELKQKQKTEIPEKLEKNEIAIILEESGGWSEYNDLAYYIFKNNGKIIAYSKQTTKDYLKNKKELKETTTKMELSDQKEKQLTENLNAKLTIKFLKYTQNSFTNNSDKSNAMCMISDATGYALTFVQNGKQNSYQHYAPEFYLNKCKDKNINKVVLGQYVELIKIWQLK